MPNINLPQSETEDIYSFNFDKSLNRTSDVKLTSTELAYQSINETIYPQQLSPGGVVNFGEMNVVSLEGSIKAINNTIFISGDNYRKGYWSFTTDSNNNFYILPNQDDGGNILCGEDNDGTNRRPLTITFKSIDGVFLTGGEIGLTYTNLYANNVDIGPVSSKTAGENLSVGDVVRLGNEAQTSDLRQVSLTTDNTSKTLISGDNTPMPSGSARKVAQKIVFGSVPERLKQVTINMKTVTNANANTWEARCHVYSDVSNAPGVDLAESDNLTTLGSGAGEKTFVFSTPYELSANTTYWLVIEWGEVDANNWGDEAGDSGTLSASGSTSGIFQGVSVSTDNGATWPAASGDSLYIKLDYTDKAGYFYKTKATNAELVDGVVGIVKTAASAGGTPQVAIHGRVIGLSGLTAGRIYYVSNTRGALATSAGTVEKKIGISTSTTELVMQVK